MSAKPPADILLHPVRMRIVVALVGRTLTAGQLRAELADVPQATLYQHLGRLTRAGALRVVEERPVRGTLERVYALGASAELQPASGAQATPDDLRHYYATFIAALLADGSRYLGGDEINPERDGFGFRQVVFNLTDEELRAMGAALNAALLPYLRQTPSPQRRRFLFSTVFIPQASLEDAPSDAPDRPPDSAPEKA